MRTEGGPIDQAGARQMAWTQAGDHAASMGPIGSALAHEIGQESQPLTPDRLGLRERADLIAAETVARPYLLGDRRAVEGAHERQTAARGVEKGADGAGRIACGSGRPREDRARGAERDYVQHAAHRARTQHQVAQHGAWRTQHTQGDSWHTARVHAHSMAAIEAREGARPRADMR